LSHSLGRRSEKSERKKGAKLIYLSPYSPDFSPIENLWSKLKIILRSIKTTNYQELGKAIEFALGSALHRQIFLTGLHTAVIVPHLFEKGYIFFTTSLLILPAVPTKKAAHPQRRQLFFSLGNSTFK
jgi:hypothetical protein